MATRKDTTGLCAKNEKGKPVDWWFMYKLPSGIQPSGKRKTQGNEYLYYDPSEQRALHLSPYRLGTGRTGALYHTLQQLLGKPSKTTGWIFYNDEYPPDMSPYQAKPKSFWTKSPPPANAKLSAKDRDSWKKRMVKEGLAKKNDKVSDAKLLQFGQAWQVLTGELAAIKKKLIAEWNQGAGAHDWPPKVKPSIHTISTKRSRGKPSDHSSNGHCKGVLAFDTASDTAFWLSHSTPRIPTLKTPPSSRFFYPEFADQYAQTFVCVSLGSVETACAIAEVMSAQHEPQVYGCRLPDAVTSKKSAALWNLAQGSVPPSYGESYSKKHPKRKPANITFKSRGVSSGSPKTFQLLAKSGAWFDDFWIDLVGPNLKGYKGKMGVDLRVETWRRLTTKTTLPRDPHRDPGSEKTVYFGSHDTIYTYKDRDYHHEFLEKNGKQVVDEVTSIDLGALTDPGGLLTGTKGAKLTGYMWSYTRDHAKWAISEEDKDRGVTKVELHDGTTLADEEGSVSDWVCVADMNRMSSQAKRGGGAVCFHEPLLWHGLNEIEVIMGKIT